MSFRSVKETAFIIAAMLHRSGKHRARLSNKSVAAISGRRLLSCHFIHELKDILDTDYDLMLGELANVGGFVLVRCTALEGEPSITPSSVQDLLSGSLPQAELDALREKLQEDVSLPETEV